MHYVVFLYEIKLYICTKYQPIGNKNEYCSKSNNL